jgi:LacI family transcriptional regulator
MSTVRLRDVAARAGVSVGSASRVINGYPNVRPELRERVEAAITELGYRRNLLAQGLRTRRTQLVSLIVPDITNPFFAELAKELELACSAAGYQLMLSNSMESPDIEQQSLAAALDHSPGGVIVVPTASTASLPDTAGIQVVVCDRRLPGCTAPTVLSDNRQGATAAVAYLRGLGHTRIACIAGPAGVEAADERLSGYLAMTGGESELVLRGPFSYEFGMDATDRLLSLPTPPTAIFASSDQQAIGVLHACAIRRVAVPGDVSVCGFDAIPLSALTSPELTTVRQPVREMAARSLGLLLGDTPAPATTIMLPTELTVRGSCAPPPRQTRHHPGKRATAPANQNSAVKWQQNSNDEQQRLSAYRLRRPGRDGPADGP